MCAKAQPHAAAHRPATAPRPQSLVKEHFERMKKEKEKDNLREQLLKLKALQRKNEDFLAEFKGETAKLNSIINEADQERLRQKKECEKQRSVVTMRAMTPRRRHSSAGPSAASARPGPTILLETPRATH